MANKMDKLRLRDILAVCNTVILFMICWIIYDYLESAKDVNSVLVDQISSVSNKILTPAEQNIINPLASVVSKINGLANRFEPELMETSDRAQTKQAFGNFLLAQIEKSNADIYSIADKENKEHASIWAMRARYEVKMISWLAWNERDVLYRLSVKDTSLKFWDLVQSKYKISGELVGSDETLKISGVR